MKYIGAHVSIAGGIENSPLNAKKIGAKAFAMFTKNQRQWQVKPLEPANITAFKKNLQRSGIKKEHVLTHDGYLINLGNPDREKRQKSLDLFNIEAQRVEQLGLSLLNFHPGSHLKGVSENECIDLIADCVKKTIQDTENVIFVIETTAGQGTNIGYSFEQLARIIDKVGVVERMGVCLDTCHIYAAGYDIKDEYERVMEHFDDIIGFDLLKGVHLNDSKANLSQKLDRHHSLGHGFLGWDVFKNIMKDSRFNDIPLILETIDSDIWRDEIKMLYNFTGDK